MKLHLPKVLLSAVLAASYAFSAQAVEIPDTFEQVPLWTADYLSDYITNNQEDQYAFILRTDVDFTPTSNPDWNSSTSLVSGGQLIFTSSEGYAPVALRFSDGPSRAFKGPASLSFDTLSKLTFSNLKDSYYGAAINLDSGSLYIHNVTDGIDDAEQADVLFSGNKLKGSSAYYGGAIRANGSSSVIDISGNGGVSFTGNYISTPSSYSDGGAICATGSLSISNNADVSFTGNYTSSSSSSSGGAIYATGSLSISNNADVSFAGNYTSGNASPSYGGAICATGSLSISNNADVSFTGNYTSSSCSSGPSCGGAICSTGSLSIVGNESVVFEKNYEKDVSTYRLRSLYMGTYSSSDNLILSAKTEGHITFYDSVYMFSYGTVSFNADYTDEDGITQKAGGDIIFSGQYTAEHLQEIKGGTAGTASEIADSQTSYIYSLITLYGGSLQVVDGAKLNGYGLTVAANSGAKLLLRDGSMSHGGYNFTFNSGTTLELQGYNTITATKITMGSGSELTVVVDAGHQNTAALTLGGTDLSTSQLTINLDRTDGLRRGMYKIISQSSTSDFTTKSAWTEANVTINGSGYANRAEFGDLVWQNGTLYYSVGRNIWSNASGDRVWNTSSDNWTMNGRSYTYLDGMDVSFTDTGAGEVALEGAVAPASIVVTNSDGCDYTFTAAGSSGRLTGATTITKSGAGALTIATANEHTGNTSLQEGTINVHHSTALGATAEGESALTTAAGTTLRVGNSSHLVLAASNSLAGAVEVESGATLEMKGNGYAASASTVSGTLAFTGSAAATGNAGALSGKGSVKVTDSQVSFESTTFTGNIEVQGKGASLNLKSGKYTGAGQIRLKGGTLSFGATYNLTLNNGGALEMLAAMDTPAELALNNLNIQSGAALKAMAEPQVESPLGMGEEVEASGESIINGAVGGVLNCNRVTLNMGASLVMDNAHFNMDGGALTLAVTKAATEKIKVVLSFDSEYTEESHFLLFSNLGTVNFIYDGITATADDSYIYTLNANDYFTGYGLTEESTLVYDTELNVLYLTHIVPEPATATLSLLALAVMAARRRRKA